MNNLTKLIYATTLAVIALVFTVISNSDIHYQNPTNISASPVEQFTISEDTNTYLTLKGGEYK